MKTTSIEANELYIKQRETDYREILSAVSNTPLTYREIFKVMFLKRYSGKSNLTPGECLKIATNFNPNTISRRTSELVGKGKLQECESRKCMEGNRKCTTYIKVDKSSQIKNVA